MGSVSFLLGVYLYVLFCVFSLFHQLGYHHFFTLGGIQGHHVSTLFPLLPYAFLLWYAIYMVDRSISMHFHSFLLVLLFHLLLLLLLDIFLLLFSYGWCLHGIFLMFCCCHFILLLSTILFCCCQIGFLLSF